MAERKILSLVVDLKDRASRGLRSLGSNMGSTFSNVAAFMRKATLAAGAFTAATALMAQRGGKVLGVQRAFGIVVGDSAAALKTLTAASRGLISEYNLMEGLNRAVTLGAAENVEQFAELTETALTLGRALGVDAAFAMESLSLGIGRQSRLILDNLGLIVSIEAANESYAEQLGKTTAELTDQEKSIAFRNAAMDAAKQKIEELGGIEENAADSVTRFKVALADGRDELAKLLATSPLVQKFFETMTRLVEGTVTVLGNLIQAFERLFGMTREAEPSMGPVVTLTLEYTSLLGGMPGKIENINRAMLPMLTTWQLIGFEMILMQDRMIALVEVVAGALTDAFMTFSSAFSKGLAEWIQGTGTLGKALQGAFLGALASIARSFAQFYAAQAVAALGAGILGDPRGFAAAAKYSAAAVLMGTVASLAQSGARGGGGGGAFAGGSLGFEEQFEGLGRTGGGTIVIEGGLLDMSDPRQADKLAEAIEELSGMRRGSVVIQQG